MNIFYPATKILPLALAIFCCLSCQEGENTKTGLKSHPGHYVAVGPFFDLSEIKHLDEIGIQGINKRYFWRTVEPNQGEYDFSSIEEDLDYCSKHNKQLIVFLCDRAFWIKGAVPPYLREHEWKNVGGGFSPIRWNPEFLNRFLAVGQAISDRFDTHPNFEGYCYTRNSFGHARRYTCEVRVYAQKIPGCPSLYSKWICHLFSYQ